MADHYSFGGLRERIEAGLARLDGDPTVDTLGAVDEFHVGGRPATKHLVEQLQLTQRDHVLDIGSGLGGTARFIASTTGAAVTGIDLTEEYVAVARWLTDRVGLGHRVDYEHGSATDLSGFDSMFTAATMVHVGMNIADKAALCEQVRSRLAADARFGIYDIMASSPETAAQIKFPVPWAAGTPTSHVSEPAAYAAHLESAGFEIIATNDRTSGALAAFEQLAKVNSDGPPALGLHLVMGPDTATKVANMATAIRGGLLRPTEIIARVAR